MSDEAAGPPRRCTSCGRTLPPDSAEGLCAICLLRAGLDTFSTDESQPTISGETETSLSRGSASNGDANLVWEDARRGDYQVGRLLGRGGMGDVYEASHIPSGRRVALKVLRRSRLGGAERARFLREGQIAASIRHPRTVFVFAAEELDGVPVIAMELLAGGTLKDRVRASGPLSSIQAATAMLDVVSGLEAARVAGILHRDVKPSNCFLDHEGAVKIGDFGISLSTLGRVLGSEVAQSGFEGSPHFAAPEQLRGEPLDVRADIYAVGASLFYVLTGRPPYDAENLQGLIEQVIHDPVPSPASLRRDIPAGLAALTTRCLNKAPSGRPQSYAELADALRRFVRDGHEPARPGVRILAGIVDNLLIGVPLGLIDMLRAFAGTGDPPTAIGGNGLLNAGGLLLALYYVVVEGTTGASVGKRLFGLRVVSATGPPGIWPVLLRISIFVAPALILFMVRQWHGPFSLFPAGTLPVMLQRPLLACAQVALLFITARPGNGWSGIHDLVSATRVISPPAPARRRLAAHHVPVSPAAADRDERLGPFEVIGNLGATDRGILITAFDPFLCRDVWIHQLSPGAGDLPFARRDVSRVTRLHWLMGRRDHSTWDAFDAPPGRPLLAMHASIDWPMLRGWLTDLSEELAHLDQDESLSSVTLAHVWVRDDGHVTLLDFPYPITRADSTTVPVILKPMELLPAVANYVIARAPRAGLYPLSLSRRVEEWRQKLPSGVPSLREEVAALAHTPDQATSVRRALPVALTLVPIVAMALAALAAMPAMRTMRTFEHASMVWWLDALLAPPTGRLKNADIRDSAERYVAERFRASLSDEKFWTTVTAQPVQQAARHALARQLLARYRPDADRLDALTARLSPEIDRATTDSRFVAEHAGAFVALIASTVSAIVLVSMMIAHLVSAAAVPGGVVARAAGLAIVTSEGREASRLRSIGRALIAWSPVLAWCLYLAASPKTAEGVSLPHWPMLAALLTNGLLAVGAIATVLHPSRGPHDALAKVWVVPR
jgi:eukaryotic-like serine/threonine-protein kinase